MNELRDEKYDMKMKKIPGGNLRKSGVRPVFRVFWRFIEYERETVGNMLENLNTRSPKYGFLSISTKEKSGSRPHLRNFDPNAAEIGSTAELRRVVEELTKNTAGRPSTVPVLSCLVCHRVHRD